LNGAQVPGSSFSNPNPAGQWEEWSVTFTAASAETLAIVDLNTEAVGNDFSIASVPDGGTTSMLLAMGLLGLGWVRRQLKK
jgi:hypothetical protein